MESVDLETVPLFAGLAPEDGDRVAAVARLLRWNAGRVVVKEGEFAFDLYAIKAGAAEVQQGAQRVATLGSGDVFGELGVVRGDAGRWSRRRSGVRGHNRPERCDRDQRQRRPSPGPGHSCAS
jgi:CRP-like cAMP-binding protein